MGSLLRPDDLTRREREVLGLIRLGLTNEEIAGRLGISLDGAKYHVSQILSKLGVGSREEAAALVLEEARPWWVRVLGWGLAAKLAGAAVVLAAAAGLGVLVWAVIATGGPGSGEDVGRVVAATPVPWVDSTPGPTPTAIPLPTPDAAVTAIRPCGSGDLKTLALPAGAALGTLGITIAVANVSDTACRLQGMPDAQLLDSKGAAVEVEVKDASCFWTSFETCLRNHPVVVETGVSELSASSGPRPGQAIVRLVYSAGGFPPCPSDAPYADRLHLVLPENGGSLDVPLGPWQFCHPVGITQFDDPALMAATPEPQRLTASIELPRSAGRGERLEFVVTLTNSGQETLGLGEPCPNYIVYWQKQVFASHALNCIPAGSLAPGESVKFQMIIELPADIPSGIQTIVWSLDGWGTAASAEIDVVDR